jgi:hypothetical protein
MEKYNFNLINFAIKRKKFLFIQFLIILVLTVVFAVPNFKQSHYYKIIFLNDSRSELLYGYEPSLINDYNRIISLLVDPIPYLDPKVDDGVSLFGTFRHVDKKKFLDKGYSDIKNFFYISLSKIDIENYKVEFVVKNEEYDIADYKVRYNQAMQEHYILQHNKFKEILDHVEEYTIERDKNYLFDDFRLGYELKFEAAKKRIIDDNLKLEEAIKELKLEEAIKKLKLEDVTKKLKLEEAIKELKLEEAIKKLKLEDVTKELKLEEAIKKLKLEDVTKKRIIDDKKRIIDDNLKLEKAIKELKLEKATKKLKLEEAIKELKLKKAAKTRVIDDHFVLKNKCYQTYEGAQNYINSLKWFHDCMFKLNVFYKEKKDRENEPFSFISKNEIEKQIENNITIHKKIISSKIITMRKKINERIEITKKKKFIDLEYLSSNYSNKNKIIELAKYFVLFSFLFFIFNINFYFFSIRKLINDR